MKTNRTPPLTANGYWHAMTERDRLEAMTERSEVDEYGLKLYKELIAGQTPIPIPLPKNYPHTL